MTGRKLVALTLVVGALVAASLYVRKLSTIQRDYFIDRRGALLESEESGGTVREDGATLSNVQLVSDSGLQVRLRVLAPSAAESKRVPLLLLIGGQRTGKDAVDLVDDTHGIAFASIDYPYAGPQSLSGAMQVIGAIPKIQNAFLDTPPALMLAMDWLVQQPWVDVHQVELVGISLGVPFAAVVGALDSRFSRVWLIHGAADNEEWVMHAARARISNPRLRTVAVRSALLLAYGASFQTADWLQEIAPRPTIIIAARNDERVPRISLDAFVVASASEHVTLLWTDGMHIGPGREHELQQIVDRVVAIVGDSSDR